MRKKEEIVNVEKTPAMALGEIGRNNLTFKLTK